MDKSVEAECDFLDCQAEFTDILIFDLENGEVEFDDEKIEKLNKMSKILQEMQKCVKNITGEHKESYQETLNELKEEYKKLCEKSKQHRTEDLTKTEL